MKWRVPIFTAVLLFTAAAFAQTDSTIYIRNFAGANVGAKVAAAQLTCGPNTQVPCILVIDPSLAAWPAGTLPALCSHCYLWDFRSGPPEGGGGANVSTVSITSPGSRAGAQASSDAVPSVTPYCDIRSQGAAINGTTDIGSAVAACKNILGTLSGGTGTIFLPCIGAGSGAGCYWANPSALTAPAHGNVKFILQGGLQLGSSLVGYGWQNWFGDTSGNYGQFQTGSTPAAIYGPNVKGTLGTAIGSAGTQETVTPTFTSGTIANLPPGSAITISGVATSSATAARTYPSSVSGQSQVVVTLASAIRVPPGEIFTLSGCSDSSFNVTNQAAQGSDYTAKTLTFFATSTTPSTATGCTVTGFNEDAFESAHIQCSNGVPDTADGFSCPSGNTVGSNKITIGVNHAHGAADLWGAVAVGPSFNTFGPQTWQSLFITDCVGMCFWADGSTNLVMDNVGATAGGYMTSGAFELSDNYLSQLHDVYGQISTFPQGGCGSGVYANCSQPSYPYALRCDAGVPGLYYQASNSGCTSDDIDQGSVFRGGIKIDGSGIGAVTGLPRVTSTMYEEVWGNAITIDNRFPLQSETALSLKDQYLQDNVTELPQYLVGYTDGGIQPGGSVTVDNNQPVDTGALVNPYFNGTLSVLGANGAFRQIPPNNTAASGVYNQGNLLSGEIENKGAGFDPEIAPYGSLPMTSYSVSAWNSLCVTAGNCTVHAVVGPDGPSGQMLAAGMDTAASSSVNAAIAISTDTRAIYAGDRYLVWTWARPGSGTNQNYLAGQVGGTLAESPVYIASGLTFAPVAQTGNSDNVCTPAGFGSGLAKNGWAPQVAVCTFTSGSSGSPTTVTYYLATSNGGTSYSWENQIAEPGWTFIPGPNNPACTAAGTCSLSADQIEEARRDQYHGCVPPNASAGQLATCESGAGGAPALGNTIDESGSWSSWSASGVYRFTGSSASTATLPSSISSPPLVASVNNGGTANVTIATGGPTLICQPLSSSCIVPPGASAFLNTDGTNWYAMISTHGVSDTTVAVSSGSQGANSCSSPATVAMTGITTAMVPLVGYSSNPSALTGWGSTGGMAFQAWPSASNTLSWIVCNQTASTISYSAVTFNVGAQ